MLNRSEKPIGLVSDNVSDKILSALRTLDDAASEKGDEIRTAVHRSFKNLGRAFTELETGSDTAMDYIEKRGKHFRDEAMKRTTKAIEKINHQFKERPWAFIGGFALLGMGIGYLIGRKVQS